MADNSTKHDVAEVPLRLSDRIKNELREWGATLSVFIPVFLIFSGLFFELRVIPSESMVPNLQVGDRVAVNKFAYGLRLPVFNKLIYKIGSPQQGDVFVFHYPKDPSIDYIKRVIGLPGDTIRYDNKKLFINNQALPQSFIGNYEYQLNADLSLKAKEFLETNNNLSHSILIHDIPSETIEFTVPEGHYFAMGDNRDNSSDSRVWGFVPDHLLVGKAFVIWLNFNDFSRMGSWIK